MSLDYFLGDDLTGYTSLHGSDKWAFDRFQKSFKHTYAIVYLNTEGLSKHELNTRFEKLKNAIKDASFSYIPQKKREIRISAKDGQKKITYEDSLQIFARESLRLVELPDEKLFDFVISLYKTHNDKDVKFLQDTFKFKSKTARLSSMYDSTGENLTAEIDILSEGFDFFDVNDVVEFDKVETEYFITSEPMCNSERHIRALRGEVF